MCQWSTSWRRTCMKAEHPMSVLLWRKRLIKHWSRQKCLSTVETREGLETHGEIGKTTDQRWFWPWLCNPSWQFTPWNLQNMKTKVFSQKNTCHVEIHTNQCFYIDIIIVISCRAETHEIILASVKQKGPGRPLCLWLENIYFF